MSSFLTSETSSLVSVSYILVAIGLFLVSMASVTGSPIGLGGYLICLSFIMACLIGVNSSGWYAFILFLVFVGGVLVLFTYVCMVSSNFVVSNLLSQVTVSVLIAFLVFALSLSPTHSGLLGYSTWGSGHEISLVTLLGLVVLLLAAFLAIVRVITAGGSLQIEPSK